MSSEDLAQQLAAELERIKALPLAEQPAAFEQIRLQLDGVLNQAEAAGLGNSSSAGN